MSATTVRSIAPRAPVNIAQFERTTVDLAGVAESRGMARRIGEMLERLRAGVSTEH